MQSGICSAKEPVARSASGSAPPARNGSFPSRRPCTRTKLERAAAGKSQLFKVKSDLLFTALSSQCCTVGVMTYNKNKQGN